MQPSSGHFGLLLNHAGLESMQDWNDDPHVTVEDVLLLLKEAAVKWPDV